MKKLFITGIIFLLSLSTKAQTQKEHTGLYCHAVNKIHHLYFKGSAFLGNRDQLISLEPYKYEPQPLNHTIVILIENKEGYCDFDGADIRGIFLQNAKGEWTEKMEYQGGDDDKYLQIVDGWTNGTKFYVKLEDKNKKVVIKQFDL